MTNYLQIFAAALSFNFSFPNYATSAFSSASKVGGSTGVFLSIDCLFIDSPLTYTFTNIGYFKVLLLGLIPIVLIGIPSIVCRIVVGRNSQRFWRFLWVISITCIFLFHPSLTQYSLRLFKCTDIGGGRQMVEMDITTKWWSPKHIKWIVSLAVPILVIYVIGLPILAFFALYMNRMKLNKPEVIHYILLLYQGLKHERYYWELVNTFRKFILIALQVFITNDFKIMKALLGACIMFILSVLQSRLRPFKIGVISDLEHREFLSSILLLYGGLIFMQDDNNLKFIPVILFIAIILANIRFWILWIFWVTWVYKKYKLVNMMNSWLKKVFCLKVRSTLNYIYL